MNNILIWNIRGLNSTPKQRELQLLSTRNNLGFMALLETKLNKQALSHCHKRFFASWQSLDNCSPDSKGRIWIMWNMGEFEVQLLHQTNQLMHLQVKLLALHRLCTFTVIYASNQPQQRLILWEDLRRLVPGGPWIIGGDFNNVLHLTDRVGGNVPALTEISPFADCLRDCGVIDMVSRGRFFT